ncbi:hypothetical protein [Sporomusa sphaeroides]|uniref:Anti-bacteriophage protein A/HamA C-terminal domain-containing protein n=1 Tax=Sporomusa sphaeroides DSM 2875 TaxID=1337886 RepID=A0ABP2C879_9FIRM|nr:hypothetical protein [Sporomusa sphaeroides]OLS54744.1 hypothetical protein SPSPH_40770 [Sporomusa sphaeroides DSM 2875]CVK20107.1 hypothetical protein SSPH_02774 [Sporomusa sphaeroides DSM 2875]
MKVIEMRAVPHTDNSHITFIRIDPENLQNTLANILKTLMDLSWLSRFDADYMKNSFKTRAEKTIADIQKKFDDCSDDTVTKEAGEYVVSELARESLLNQLSYLHIPLSELLGMKISGNPGFDFHSQNNGTDTIIFGEAKYNSRQSAYSTAIAQVSQFIDEKKDIMQIAELQHFCSPAALTRANDGFRGFAIAFSAKSTSSDDMIASIIAHGDFSKLLPFEEIVMVAVNL